MFYTKKTLSNGTVAYFNNEGRRVSKDKIDEATLAKLDIAEEGTEVPVDASVTATADNEAKDVKGGVTIRLKNPLCVNGKVYVNTRDITVPKDVAEDLQRIDAEYIAYEQSLFSSKDKTRSYSEIKTNDSSVVAE